MDNVNFLFVKLFIVKYRVNKKYDKKKINIECNLGKCNIDCSEFRNKKCEAQKYCSWSNKLCKKNISGCKKLVNKIKDIDNKINKKIKSKFDILDYYKIRGINFKKHIEYYLIILIITFFIFLFTIIIMT